MLLPSAIQCDMRRPTTRSRFTPSRLFSTPPPSDDDLPSGNGGLFGTCRALQSLLNGSPAPSAPSPRRAKPARLQSPAQIRTTPVARERRVITPSSPRSSASPKSVAATTPRSRSRPRGANKRRRSMYEEDVEMEMQSPRERFSTPKRRRQIPYDLPLGLSQSDFYSLHTPPVTQSPPSQRRVQQPLPADSAPHTTIDPDAPLPSIEEADEETIMADPAADDDWTAEDDQRLVGLVLDKLKLSRRDWDECARRLGKDKSSIGRRWEELLGEGDVGLRRGRRLTRSRVDQLFS